MANGRPNKQVAVWVFQTRAVLVNALQARKAGLSADFFEQYAIPFIKRANYEVMPNRIPESDTVEFSAWVEIFWDELEKWAEQKYPSNPSQGRGDWLSELVKVGGAAKWLAETTFNEWSEQMMDSHRAATDPYYGIDLAEPKGGPEGFRRPGRAER